MIEDKNIALGVDIGGSHITAAAVDLNSFKILPNSCFNSEIDNKASKDTILNAWAGTIRQTLKTIDSEIEGVGIAIPGPFDYPNGIGMFEGNDKYEVLYNVDIRTGLCELLGLEGEKIHFFNDAFSFAIGAALVKHVLQKRVMGITLGTGFGAAFLINELPTINDPSIPENGCLWDKNFKNSIADDFFSTRWFLKRYEELTGKTCSGVREIVETENEHTHRLFDEFARNLTEFLSPHLIKFKAEALLIGGNIAKSHHLFLDALKDSLGNATKLQIEIINNTETCNMLGASHLMRLNYWDKQKKLKSFF